MTQNNQHRNANSLIKVKRQLKLNSHSIRELEFTNLQLLKHLSTDVDQININMYRIMRTFTEYKSQSSNVLLDEYFDISINFIEQLIDGQLQEHEELLEQYKQNHYHFNIEGETALVEYKITRGKVDTILTLYKKMDDLLLSAKFLEKTSYYTEKEFGKFQYDWISLLTNFSKSLKRLSFALQQRFKMRVQARLAQSDIVDVKFADLNHYLIQHRSDFLRTMAEKHNVDLASLNITITAPSDTHKFHMPRAKGRKPSTAKQSPKSSNNPKKVTRPEPIVSPPEDTEEAPVQKTVAKPSKVTQKKVINAPKDKTSASDKGKAA